MKTFLTAVLALCFLAMPAMASDRGTAEEAQAMVMKAIEYYNEHGQEEAFKAFEDQEGKFRDRDLYVFVMEHKGLMVSHGGNPGLVGKNIYELKDADGNFFSQKFEEVATSEEGEGWVDYKWPNPQTKKVENKSTFIKDLGNGLMVGVGIYKE